MKHILSAFVAGLLFGLGLSSSGMTQPGKVMGFLDITGAWDPSLAFVMGGALCIFGPTYFFLRPRREQPILAVQFDLPTKTQITPKLGIGAAIFGIGWGLAGFCPGTALTSLPTGSPTVLTLMLGVFIGILGTWGAQSALSDTGPVAPQADF